jgi:hypothetical protein
MAVYYEKIWSLLLLCVFHTHTRTHTRPHTPTHTHQTPPPPPSSEFQGSLQDGNHILQPVFDLKFGVGFVGTENAIMPRHGVKTSPNNQPDRPGVQDYNCYLLIYLLP